ncbi:MAG: CocE/NonD family hydrolase [Alphaproteobacteria bacterium]|nr:CocE/NonD family hydrolase [Alphaproteobacteria bacterium]
MKPVRTKYPRGVKTIENVFIPMPGGHRLAARMWLPEDAEADKVPAIFEYMPYRKRDQSRARDEAIHRYIAGHGYACLRIDTRGSGDSDGLLRGEWEQGELDDGIAAIEWMTKQPWCSGTVGMIGKSWSGFSALAIAGLAPPALKAIVPVCAGDDRYHQSLHWTGGAFLCEQLWWTDTMVQFNARPPDPAIVGERWREIWKARLADNHPWLIDWLKHQRRDDFWKHASLCERFDKVSCAVFAVGGWADYISRAIPRLMANLKGPRFGLIGPWGHHYPHDGVPEPAVGFLQDCVRFFDRYTKDILNGWDAGPSYRAYLQSFSKPSPKYAAQPGRWIAIEGWPSEKVQPLRFHLNRGRLDKRPKPEQALPHSSPLATGLAATEWLSMAIEGEQPRDQREDDGRSLVFDSEPLKRSLDILGRANIEIDLAVDRPVAQLCARLCEVAPDGTSVRVAFQVLNLTHRNSHESPERLIRGQRIRVRLGLPDVGWTFAKGNRIRLALSTSYWPIVWPAPEPVTMTVFTGASTVSLPVLRGPVRTPRFGPNERGPEIEVDVVHPKQIERRIIRDAMTGEITVETEGIGGFLGPGRQWLIRPIETFIGHELTKRFTITEGDPASGKGEYKQTYELSRGDWRIRLETRTLFRGTETDWVLTQELVAYDDHEEVFRKTWSNTTPRDLM